MNAADKQSYSFPYTESLLCRKQPLRSWEAITTQYPYFAIGHLLLAKKIKQEQPGKYSEQWQHCAAYFPGCCMVAKPVVQQGHKL